MINGNACFAYFNKNWGIPSIAARTIIELNIKHYRDLLRTETDPSKRRVIAKLLAEEEAKLAKLLTDKRIDE
jgi:predicted phosphatase